MQVDFWEKIKSFNEDVSKSISRVRCILDQYKIHVTGVNIEITYDDYFGNYYTFNNPYMSNNIKFSFEHDKITEQFNSIIKLLELSGTEITILSAIDMIKGFGYDVLYKYEKSLKLYYVTINKGGQKYTIKIGHDIFNIPMPERRNAERLIHNFLEFLNDLDKKGDENV